MINKVTLRVDSNFSGYAMCNIGNKTGKDPLGRPCPVGGYCCYCEEDTGRHQFPPESAPCNATVGHANLFKEFSHSGGHFWPCTKDYECWAHHAAAKLTAHHPGAWYSPLDYGACSLHPGSAANCTWEVKSIDKIVNATCHTESFLGAVQTAAPSCFLNCSSSPAPNASDPCWIRCFYEAVLGPDAAKPFAWKVAGLPLEDLIKFWSAPFESDEPARGGCPGLPIPPLAEASQLAHQRRPLVPRTRLSSARPGRYASQRW